ncbi:transcription elongation factor Spt5 [Candidatus Woesearchaeota archaeon]|nr:transcription elongation factor Spt5 [Candidatus Woesearchaeota archaeon]
MALYVIKATVNREEQVMDFISSNAKKKHKKIYSLMHPHDMRGYVIVEAEDMNEIREAYQGVPYVNGILPKPLKIEEIEGMIDQTVAQQVNIQKGDIVEIISGPFKREKARVTRVELGKEEAVVEILESAVPIPITVKIDSIKVIRREGEEENIDAD